MFCFTYPAVYLSNFGKEFNVAWNYSPVELDEAHRHSSVNKVKLKGRDKPTQLQRRRIRVENLFPWRNLLVRVLLLEILLFSRYHKWESTANNGGEWNTTWDDYDKFIEEEDIYVLNYIYVELCTDMSYVYICYKIIITYAYPSIKCMNYKYNIQPSWIAYKYLMLCWHVIIEPQVRLCFSEELLENC